MAVYDRANSAQRVDELRTFIPARNRALQGTSSYINYFLDRDSRPGHEQPLITISNVKPKPVSTRETEEPLVKTHSAK